MVSPARNIQYISPGNNSWRLCISWESSVPNWHGIVVDLLIVKLPTILSSGVELVRRWDFWRLTVTLIFLSIYLINIAFPSITLQLFLELSVPICPFFSSQECFPSPSIDHLISNFKRNAIFGEHNNWSMLWSLNKVISRFPSNEDQCWPVVGDEKWYPTVWTDSDFIKSAILRCMSSLELRPFMSGSHAFADLSMNGFSKRMTSGKYLGAFLPDTALPKPGNSGHSGYFRAFGGILFPIWRRNTYLQEAPPVALLW